MRSLLTPLGVCTLAGAWLGLPGLLLPGPFSAHMTQHMAVVAVAAPLLAFGIAGGRLDPVRRWPAAFAVVPASIAELLLVWGWHTPALHHAARTSLLAFLGEQGSFLASGLWLWLSAVGGERSGERQNLRRSGAGIVGLLLTCMHMTLLGALLALPPRPLYAHGETGGHEAHASHGGVLQASDARGADARISPLDDQHLGGAIMIVLGGASYLAGGLWLAVGLLRRRANAERNGTSATAESADPMAHVAAVSALGKRTRTGS
jgi:putative membrane protein